MPDAVKLMNIRLYLPPRIEIKSGKDGLGHMNKTDHQEQDSAPAYEPPRLDVVSLHAEEAMAVVCKDIGAFGPQFSNCEAPLEQGPCEEPGS